jgi:hypothetical protein
MDLNESVKYKKISECPEPSEFVQKIIAMLKVIGTWVDEIPPIEGVSKFWTLVGKPMNSSENRI